MRRNSPMWCTRDGGSASRAFCDCGQAIFVSFGARPLGELKCGPNSEKRKVDAVLSARGTSWRRPWRPCRHVPGASAPLHLQALRKPPALELQLTSLHAVHLRNELAALCSFRRPAGGRHAPHRLCRDALMVARRASKPTPFLGPLPLLRGHGWRERSPMQSDDVSGQVLS